MMVGDECWKSTGATWGFVSQMGGILVSWPTFGLLAHVGELQACRCVHGGPLLFKAMAQDAGLAVINSRLWNT
jgi:hypothetical protein